MAAVSEAMMIYNTRIVPSYVSSNGYYGYVPPINELVEHHSNYQQVQLNINQHHNQQSSVQLSNGHGINSEALPQHQNYNEQYYDCNNSSAMETDGDATHVGDTQFFQNNHCVIPEAARRLVNGCDGDSNAGVGALCQVANNNINSMTRNQAKNRKRSYNGPALLFSPETGQMKKLRQEAVVTATITTVQTVQGNMDRPRCLMSHHHYA